MLENLFIILVGMVIFLGFLVVGAGVADLLRRFRGDD